MSFKAVWWILIAAMALSAVLLLNYWGAYQPLSTLAYCGIVLAFCGLANVAIPFRFLGIRRRALGTLIFVGGVCLATAALNWPAPMMRVAQHKTALDEVMPEYQFNERHSKRVHARPEQVMQAVRESTFGDMKSLATLLRIRAAALRIHDSGDFLKGRRVLEAFAASGFQTIAGDSEIVVFGGANARAGRPLALRNSQEFVNYQEPGAVKIAFDFGVLDAGGGWSILTTETRVVGLDDLTRRGMGRYWRLMVPGSGLLRHQWLDAIKKRAESAPQSAVDFPARSPKNPCIRYEGALRRRRLRLLRISETHDSR